MLSTLVNKDDSQSGIYVAVVLLSLATYFGSLNEPLPSLLDFKLSPCFEYCMYSFGYFPGVRLWYFVLYIQPLKMELIEGSETSENHNRTPGKYPKEYIQYITKSVT